MLSPEKSAHEPAFWRGEPARICWRAFEKVNFILGTLSITYKKLLSVFITLYQYPGLRNSDFVTLHSQLTTEHTEHTD
jgi:hypothetical protein